MSNTVQDVLGSLKPGDIIQTTRTHRVLAKQEHFVKTADVQNGDIAFGITLDRDSNHGSLRVEVVKKAAPKPRVGDALTANQVRDIQWKRGTVLTDGEGFVYLLSARGHWVSPNNDSDSDTYCDFLDLDPYGKYTVAYLP